MKTISCIIPLYNQGEYLSDAVESCLNQTRSPNEVIIIDDGSTDRSLEIAKRWESDKRVKVIHQINKGLPSARNTGVMNATTDYLFMLDADDILVENCIERILDVAEETDADIIAPSFKCFGLSQEVIILGKNPKRQDFLSGNRLGYFSAIKREALLECGGYSPRMQHGWEDLALWFDLLGRGKTLEVIQEPLVLYRTKEQSMWRDSVKHSKELWAQIFKDFPELVSEEVNKI